MRRVLALLAFGFALTPTARARACGVSGPDGASACSLDEHEAASRRMRVGVSGLYTSTALRFGGGLRGDQTRLAVLASIAYQLPRRVTLQGAAGTAFGGDLTMPDGVHRFLPGPIAALGVSWRAVDGPPFLVFSSQISFSAATTQMSGSTDRPGYEAFDLRAGVLFGTTIFDVLSPYVTGRIFGGPVFWRYQGTAVEGTDVAHYQLGGGLAVSVAKRVDLFAEGIPAGERAISAGLSVRF
ncbi:MAG: hypothetical protein ABIP39_10165 [Polyangiaceae bacterium]